MKRRRIQDSDPSHLNDFPADSIDSRIRAVGSRGGQAWRWRGGDASGAIGLPCPVLSLSHLSLSLPLSPWVS
eukprot:COSAG02_NODE_6722_length_3401_cov_4.311932_3_plen_72_part_00